MKNEIIVSPNNRMVSKPFIFTNTGSMAFYADEHRMTIVETAPVDDRSKSFYFHLSKDDEQNYELHLRVNPPRVLQTVGNILSVGNTIRNFFC